MLYFLGAIYGVSSFPILTVNSDWMHGKLPSSCRIFNCGYKTNGRIIQLFITTEEWLRKDKNLKTI